MTSINSMNNNAISGFLDKSRDMGHTPEEMERHLLRGVTQELMNSDNVKAGFTKRLENLPDDVREKVASLLNPDVVLPIAVTTLLNGKGIFSEKFGKAFSSALDE